MKKCSQLKLINSRIRTKCMYVRTYLHQGAQYATTVSLFEAITAANSDRSVMWATTN